MTYFKFRLWTKAVAFVDTIVVCISVALVSFLACLLLAFTISHINPNFFRDPREVQPVVEAVETDHLACWILAVSGILLVVAATLILIWALAALNLVAASEFGKEPRNALRLARFWRNVTAVYLGIAILISLGFRNLCALLISIAWRGSSLYVVCNFVTELETFIASPSGSCYLAVLTGEKVLGLPSA